MEIKVKISNMPEGYPLSYSEMLKHEGIYVPQINPEARIIVLKAGVFPLLLSAVNGLEYATAHTGGIAFRKVDETITIEVKPR